MLDALFSGVASFVIRVVKPVIQAAIQAVLQELNITNKNRTSATPHAKAVTDIDEEISDMERSAARAGRRLSPSDEEQIDELNRKKAEEFSNFQQVKKAEVADELASAPGSFTTSDLSNGQEHQLQYHLGLVVLEKRCPVCGYPMKLQHKTVDEPSFNDFFWQCTRFYVKDGQKKCRSQQFTARDLKLLHKSDVLELQVSKADLTTIASEKSIQKTMISRMNEHLGKGDEDIVCPVHFAPMILREKNGAADCPLLDRYHLRCAHFQCSQTTKLKSFPQLAAYLRRQEGTGILH